jgi:hypothetical protein
MCVGNPEALDLPGGERAGRRPVLPPAMRGALESPLGATEEITPAAAANQDAEYGIDDLATGSRRHTTTLLRRLRRKKVCKELPRRVA